MIPAEGRVNRERRPESFSGERDCPRMAGRCLPAAFRGSRQGLGWFFRWSGDQGRSGQISSDISVSLYFWILPLAVIG